MMTHATETQHVQLVPLDIEGLDSSLLDCYENNLQVMAWHAGAADVGTPFARDWGFRHPGPGGPPQFARQPIEERLRDDTGLGLSWHEVPADVPPVDACARLLDRGQAVLALADAYDMEWLPYAGHAHMTHSFIVSGVDASRSEASIVDAYHNDTAWGPARPSIVTLDCTDLARLLDGVTQLGTVQPERPAYPVDVRTVLLANAHEIAQAMAPRGDLPQYVDLYRNHASDPEVIASVALACWLGERSRTRYARWLGRVAGTLGLRPLAQLADAFASDVAATWRRASELAYLADQRVRRGRKPPTAVFDILVGPIATAESAAASQHLAIAGRLAAGTAILPSLGYRA